MAMTLHFDGSAIAYALYAYVRSSGIERYGAMQDILTNLTSATTTDDGEGHGLARIRRDVNTHLGRERRVSGPGGSLPKLYSSVAERHIADRKCS